MSNENIACVTIVSKNYISSARALCDSFLSYHPGSRFFVVLADRNDGYIDVEKEKFELLHMTDVGVPNPSIFPYQYDVTELNTAVKPFALYHILEVYDEIEKIAYIDPDILIFHEMDRVWNALDHSSIVLTPHMRRPYNDKAHPSELSIIQSGTYNLGFIGLRKSKSAARLLRWWSEKLYLNCVIDIKRGLFTDQKWIDLVPAYFPDVYILRDPEYNVAYWNLHERRVSIGKDGFIVDGRPLVFFHYSGFDPRKPDVLSKHQNRHRINDSRALKDVFDIYFNRLMSFEALKTREWPYAYGKLPNGVKVNTAIHSVIRKCLENNIGLPDPESQPDKLCEFLMTPNRNIYGKDVAPIVSSILDIRTDVRDAFPNAVNDKEDPGFLNWLWNTGFRELGLEELSRWKDMLVHKNPILSIADIYHSRGDVMDAYPDAYVSSDGIEGFHEWLLSHGLEEYSGKITSEDVELHYVARKGVLRILNFFYSRVDLQKHFSKLGEPSENKRFVDWLLSAFETLPGISEAEVHFFDVWAKHNITVLRKINLNYNYWVRSCINAIPNVFSADRISDMVRLLEIDMDFDAVRDWLVNDFMDSPLQHLVAYYVSDAQLRKRHPLALDSVEGLKELFEHVLHETDIRNFVHPAWIAQCEKEIQDADDLRDMVNVIGYFGAATGMGESARSMKRTLEAGGDGVVPYVLPSVYCDGSGLDIPETGKLFGTINLFAKKTIVVANADTVPLVRKLLPLQYLSGKKIGYWVWETESLPERWKHNADIYDEIWTPSLYSARAIQSTIGRDVKVVPHALDMNRLKSFSPDRERFGLPENGVIYAYFFDPKSFIERKNPEAVIDAFQQALSEEEDAWLLFKVNSPRVGDIVYERLKARTKGLRVIWIEDQLPIDDVYTLMASIDVYVSLHRSEGFGLTIAEAIAMGKPVIATGYSGNMQFMTEDNSYPVSYERRKIDSDIGPYEKGGYWAEPSIVHAAEIMREVYEGIKRGSMCVGNIDDLDPVRVYERHISFG